MTYCCKTTSIQRATLNGSTSGSTTLQKNKILKLTLSILENQILCLTMACCRVYFLLRRKNEARGAGFEGENTLNISKTTMPFKILGSATIRLRSQLVLLIRTMYFVLHNAIHTQSVI